MLTDSTSIRTVVVEDEVMARDQLVQFLRDEPDIELVAACDSGASAIAVLQSTAVDLVLLDLEMPGMSGFGVIEAIGPSSMPPTIVVTAHDEYALQAFDVHAFDYLLKPFGRDRLHEALERMRIHIGNARDGALARRLLALSREVQAPEPHGARFLVKSAGRVLFVGFDEIDWIESNGNYVRLHAGGRTHVMRETMSSIEHRLGGRRFARVHRTRIVNLDRVTALNARGNGEYDVELRDGTKFPVGRAYREELEARLTK
jgi:two-component system LytT family response regulator